MASVDFKKAFGRVDRENLFDALSNNVCRNLIPFFCVPFTMVTLEGDGTFFIERVEQGDKLNPLLSMLEQALST